MGLLYKCGELLAAASCNIRVHQVQCGAPDDYLHI
jgi:hypothetical protein